MTAPTDKESLAEENARLRQQIKYITENAARVINEKIAAEEEMARRVRFSEAITAVAAATIEHPQELDPVLKLALDKVLDILWLPNGSIHVLDEKAGGRLMIVYRGLNPDKAQELRLLKADKKGLGAHVLVTGEPLIIPDIDAVEKPAVQPVTKGDRAHAAIPLKSAEKVVGHLVVAGPQPHQFTPQEVEFLTTIGHLVGIALENARLFREMEERARRIETILELSSIIGSSLHIQEVYVPFVHALKKVVPADWVSLNLVDKEKRSLRLFALHTEVGSPRPSGEAIPLATTATQWVMAHRKAIYEADLSQEKQFGADKLLAGRGLRSVVRLPLIAQGEPFGSLGVGSREPGAYSQGQLQILEELAAQIASAISNDRFYEENLRQKEEMERTLFAAMRAVVLAEESGYPFYHGHIDKVTYCARIIAQAMNLPERERRDLEIAACLHDIGMTAIPGAIINKKGSLTPEESILMETHPAKGAELLGFSPLFREVASLVRGHHEHFDGRGYPDGLRGEHIPLGARILAVAEAYASLTMDSPSRPAFSHQEALDMVKAGAGSRFDPRVVEALIKALGSQANTDH